MDAQKQPLDDRLSMLDKIDLILGVVEESGYLTLSGVMERTGLARSTAHRLLTQMERRRWLYRVGTNYELGVRLFDLGTKGVRNHWFYRRAMPALRWLHAQTGFVVHLTYLDGADAVYWEKLGDGRFGAAMPSRIGHHTPANATASGKALLAAQPGGYVESLGPFEAVTERTVSSARSLRAELETVRRRGFAVDEGELLPGVGCYAATVHAGGADLTIAHRTTAAISVCVPLERLDRRLITPLATAREQIIHNTRINPMAESADAD